MRTIRKLGLALALFCTPHLFPATLESASPPPTKVVVISASLSEKLAAYFVAQDQNLFRKYDLDVQLVLVRTGPVALSSMIAGDAQFSPLRARRRLWRPLQEGSIWFSRRGW